MRRGILMPPNQKHHTRELTRIEQLLDTYNFKEALQAVETLEHRDDLSPSDRLTCHLLKSRLLNTLGRYEETLRLTETILKESQSWKTRLHKVDALIARAEALGFLGRFEEGLDAIKQGEHELAPLARNQPAEVPQRTAALLCWKGFNYGWKGELGQALEYAQQSLALREKLGHKKEIADSLVWIGWIYSWKGEVDRVLEYGQQGLALAEELGHKPLIIWSLQLIGWSYNGKGERDRALEYCQQSLALAEELGHKLAIVWSLNIIGWSYIWKGELDRAMEYGQQGLALAKEFSNKLVIASFLESIGRIYYLKGELDRAEEHWQQELALAEELGHKLGIAWSLLSIGWSYSAKGELDQALEHWQQCLTLAKELGHKLAIAGALNNIGYTYWMKGELGRALEHGQQSLALYEEQGNKLATANVRDTIGVIYHQKGELEQAVAHLEQSLALAEELGANFNTAYILFHLISVTLDMASLDRARRYLQRLQQLNEQVPDNTFISQLWRVAEALVLKTSTRARHRVKAEELLEQVAEEEVVDPEVTVAALLHLCDLLLAELRVSGDPEVLGEVQAHVTRLREIAQQQHSHWVLAETYVLQAKLALVKLDVQRARRFLEQAQRLAEDRGLQRLAMRISTEHDALLDQLGQWEDYIDRNASLAERAELAHLEEQVVRMVRRRVGALLELPQEEPELLLIVGADSGLNVFSKSFRPDRPLAEHLIAGFLTAINALVRDAFAATGSIERIKHQEHTLLLKAVEPFLVSYVFQGPSYFALKKLDQFVKALQASSKVWKTLTEALQTRRFVVEGGPLEALVSEMFLTPTEGH